MPVSGIGIHERMFRHKKTVFFFSSSVVTLRDEAIRRQKRIFQRFQSSTALSATAVKVMELSSVNFRGNEIHVHDTEDLNIVNVHYFLGGKKHNCLINSYS